MSPYFAPGAIRGTGAITATEDPVPVFKELVSGGAGAHVNRPWWFYMVGVQSSDYRVPNSPRGSEEVVKKHLC